MKQFTVKDALISLVSHAQWSLRGNEYSGIEWHDTEIVKPTEEEINAEILRLNNQTPLDNCKKKAQLLLQETDWVTFSDVISGNPSLNNQSEFLEYRSTLRNLLVNPITNPFWPTIPKAQWTNE